MRKYLLIPHLRIHNANAMSSPYTLGVPAMTAWLGAMHALQRRLRAKGMGEVALNKIAISYHACNLQVYKGPRDYVQSVIGTANPLRKKGAEYVRPSFVEEPRCHLNVTLLIEIGGVAPNNEQQFLELLHQELPRMKFAGGDVESIGASWRHEPVAADDEAQAKKDSWGLAVVYIKEDADEERDTRRLLGRMMPGWVLIKRRDIMAAGQGDALERLLEALAIHYQAEETDTGVTWKPQKQPGWLVPVAVGYQDISGPLEVTNQRAYDAEHHFVEPLVTLGEFVMPYKYADSIEDIMWSYHYDAERGQYLCLCAGK